MSSVCPSPDVASCSTCAGSRAAKNNPPIATSRFILILRPLVAYLRDHNSLRPASGCGNESLHRFEVRLAAQAEGLMMDRQQMFGAAIGAHAPRLLGIA